MNVVTVTFNDPIYSGDQDYTYINGVRFTGLLKILDDDGNLVSETEFKDGRVNGYDREYYSGGNQLKNDISGCIEFAGKTLYIKEWDEQGNLIYHENTYYQDHINYTTEIIVNNRP